MTKHDLANQVAEVAQIDHRVADKAISALTAVIADQVAHEGAIRIHGLGQFKAVDRPARTARNPKTGAPVSVPAKRVVKFSATKGLAAAG